MFFKTKDEVEAGCTIERFDPGLTAAPYADDDIYEASAGSPGAATDAPPTPLAIAESLKEIFDPEIPVNIYDLGLIYDINVNDAGDVRVLMTLTAPNCPAAGILPGEIAECVSKIPGVARVGVQLTFDVPWNVDMMSEIAKVDLGML